MFLCFFMIKLKKNKKLTTEERSKVKRFLTYLYQNKKYDGDEYKTNKNKLLECIDLVDEKSIFNKKEAINIRLFLDGAVVDFKENRFGFIVDDKVFVSAYNKIHNMFLNN